jgi:hypothetical protein
VVVGVVVEVVGDAVVVVEGAEVLVVAGAGSVVVEGEAPPGAQASNRVRTISGPRRTCEP